MKRKEPTFMMISNCKKTFVSTVYVFNIAVVGGQMSGLENTCQGAVFRDNQKTLVDN